MKNFIRKTILFFMLSVILIFITISISFIIINKKSDFILKENPKYIVSGHSHTESAYNDSLISGLKNISRSGEAYFYSYQKIKMVLKQNPMVKTVFIEFTNNQVTGVMDKWIWDDIHITRYLDFVPFMSVSDKFLLFKENSYGFYNLLSISTLNALLRVVRSNYSYEKQLDGYRPLEEDKTDSILTNLSKNKINTQKELLNVSEANLSYLSAIINYCKSNDVEPILIRSPLHKAYVGFNNESTYKKILKKRFSNITYLDFSSFPLTNTEFGDLQHLNYKGARIFSLWFNEILSKGLLYKKNREEFVKMEIGKRYDRSIMKGVSKR